MYQLCNSAMPEFGFLCVYVCLFLFVYVLQMIAKCPAVESRMHQKPFLTMDSRMQRKEEMGNRKTRSSSIRITRQ